MMFWRLIAKLTACRTRLSCHGLSRPLDRELELAERCVEAAEDRQSIRAAQRRGAVGVTVAPWIDPARSAATRVCSSVITLYVIESRYGSPGFQKLGS